MAFDPDAYLSGGTQVVDAPFNPDAYLADSEPKSFNPDEYLGEPPPKAVTFKAPGAFRLDSNPEVMAKLDSLSGQRSEVGGQPETSIVSDVGQGAGSPPVDRPGLFLRAAGRFIETATPFELGKDLEKALYNIGAPKLRELPEAPLTYYETPESKGELIADVVGRLGGVVAQFGGVRKLLEKGITAAGTKIADELASTPFGKKAVSAAVQNALTFMGQRNISLPLSTPVSERLASTAAAAGESVPFSAAGLTGAAAGAAGKVLPAASMTALGWAMGGDTDEERAANALAMGILSAAGAIKSVKDVKAFAEQRSGRPLKPEESKAAEEVFNAIREPSTTEMGEQPGRPEGPRQEEAGRVQPEVGRPEPAGAQGVPRPAGKAADGKVGTPLSEWKTAPQKFGRNAPLPDSLSVRQPGMKYRVISDAAFNDLIKTRKVADKSGETANWSNTPLPHYGLREGHGYIIETSEANVSESGFKGQDASVKRGIVPAENITRVWEIRGDGNWNANNKTISIREIDPRSVLSKGPQGQAADGKVVYHGTPNVSFDTLKPSDRGDLGAGVYLARDKNVASRFSDMAFRRSTLEPRGNGEFVDINTGEVIRPENPGVRSVDISGLNIKRLSPGEFDAEIENLRDKSGVLPSDYETQAQQRFIKEGYDGIEVSGTPRGDNDQIVIFQQASARLRLIPDSPLPAKAGADITRQARELAKLPPKRAAAADGKPLTVASKPESRSWIRKASFKALKDAAKRTKYESGQSVFEGSQIRTADALRAALLDHRAWYLQATGGRERMPISEATREKMRAAGRKNLQKRQDKADLENAAAKGDLGARMALQEMEGKAEEVPIERLNVGDEFTMGGEKFRVLEETDMALRLKDGIEFSVPYGEVDAIPIDKGSHKKAAAPLELERQTPEQVQAEREAAERKAAMATAQEKIEKKNAGASAGDMTMELIPGTSDIPLFTAKPLERSADLVAGAVGGWKQQSIPVPANLAGTMAATKLDAMFAKRDAQVEQKLRTTWGQVRDVIGSQLVAFDAPIRRRLESDAAERVIILKDLARGASSEAVRRYENARDDVFKTIPYAWEREFGRYLEARRTLEVSKLKGPDFKSPDGLGAAEAQAWLDRFDTAADPRLKASFAQASQKYYSVFHDNIRRLADEGIITPEVRDDLIAKHQNYSPREFIEFLDPGAASGGKAGFVQTTDSGIKALKEGSDSMLYSNPRYFMAQALLRTEKRIANNRAAAALYDYVSSTPDNALGAQIFNKRMMDFVPEKDPATGKVLKDPATGKPLGRFVATGRIADAPAGFETITSYAGGQPQAVAVPHELAQYWKNSEPALNRTAAEVIGWVSGSKVVKAMATGYNPEFVLSNLPRDIMFNWFTTREYNPVLPIGLAQLGTDYIRVAHDAFTKKGRYVDYVKQGGGMEYLSTAGLARAQPWEADTPITRQSRGLIRLLNKFNETSEIWTRLAVRDRAIRNGRDPQAATWIARNALDFAQGGTAVKMLDSGMPYLNAMVQGTRGVARAFRTSPALAMLKAGQLVGLGMLMYYAHRDDPYDTVSNQEKSQKWILGFIPPKQQGKAIFNRYMAISKDQGQQLFAALGEAIASYLDTGKANVEPLKYAWNNNIPGISVLPPVLSAWIAYFRNFDTYRMQQVWRGREVSKKSLEQSPKTPASAVAITEQLAKAGIEISPERAAVAFTKLVPNNPLSWLVGQAADVTIPQDPKLGPMVERWDEWPMMRRFIRTTPRINPTLQDSLEAGRLGISTKGKSRMEIQDEVREVELKRNDERQATDNLLQRPSTNRFQNISRLMGEADETEAARIRKRVVSSLMRE